MAMEHRLDSLMSAYVAAHWWYWGRERNDVLGDAASGYIVVPRRRTADLKLADLREDLKTRGLEETRSCELSRWRSSVPGFLKLARRAWRSPMP